jgi:hypothetical protein
MRDSSIRIVEFCLAAGLLALPAQAHKTEVSGDVAGTWHLEPNHSPKAGEPARVWVALTQRGGKVISLQHCDCRLAIYNASEAAAVPVLEPPLQAFSPENYQSIPGTEVTFPEVGKYRLILTGRPRGSATFTPFELSYTTSVAAGQVTTAAPLGAEATAQRPESAGLPVASAQPSVAAKPWILGVGAVSAISIMTAAIRCFCQRKTSHR